MVKNSHEKTSDIYSYLSNNPYYPFTIVFFYTFVVCSALLIFTALYASIKYNIDLHNQVHTAKAALQYITDIYIAASGWLAIVFLLCVFSFLLWLCRTSTNTHTLYPQEKISFSPAWCIASYFIPLLNWIWPYTSMKELWLLNVGNQEKRGAGIVLVWWITFMLFVFSVSNAYNLSSYNTPDPSQYIVIDALANIFGIISTLTMIKIMKGIFHAQAYRLKQLSK